VERSCRLCHVHSRYQLDKLQACSLEAELTKNGDTIAHLKFRFIQNHYNREEDSFCENIWDGYAIAGKAVGLIEAGVKVVNE
jgi:hypothetical protein